MPEFAFDNLVINHPLPDSPHRAFTGSPLSRAGNATANTASRIFSVPPLFTHSSVASALRGYPLYPDPPPVTQLKRS